MRCSPISETLDRNPAKKTCNRIYSKQAPRFQCAHTVGFQSSSSSLAYSNRGLLIYAQCAFCLTIDGTVVNR